MTTDNDVINIDTNERLYGPNIRLVYKLLKKYHSTPCIKDLIQACYNTYYTRKHEHHIEHCSDNTYMTLCVKYTIPTFFASLSTVGRRYHGGRMPKHTQYCFLPLSDTALELTSIDNMKFSINNDDLNNSIRQKHLQYIYNIIIDSLPIYENHKVMLRDRISQNIMDQTTNRRACTLPAAVSDAFAKKHKTNLPVISLHYNEFCNQVKKYLSPDGDVIDQSVFNLKPQVKYNTRTIVNDMMQSNPNITCKELYMVLKKVLSVSFITISGYYKENKKNN